MVDGVTDLGGPQLAPLAIGPERGWIARFLRWAFSQVTLPADSQAQLLHAAQSHTLVFILPTVSTIAGFWLGDVLRRLGLAPLRFISHSRLLFWQPLRLLWRMVRAPKSASPRGFYFNTYGDDHGGAFDAGANVSTAGVAADAALDSRPCLVPSLRSLWFRRNAPQEALWLRMSLQSNASVALFLQRPLRLSNLSFEFERVGLHAVTQVAIYALQRAAMEQLGPAPSQGSQPQGGQALPKPLLFVPLAIFYNRKPDSFRLSLIDVLLGPRSGPGRLREFVLFVLNRGRARMVMGEPFAFDALCSEFAAASQPLSPLAIAHHIVARAEEAHRKLRLLVRGPQDYDRAALMRQILEEPPIQEACERAMVEQAMSNVEARRYAARALHEMAAHYREHVIVFFRFVLDWLFTRIYDGVEVDEASFEAVREAAGRGPLLIVPSHKSHIDYLIMSYVFYQRGLKCPHIAAGVNLSFWPVGPLFRGAGAFFLRRSFKQDPLYALLLKSYLQTLMRRGFSMEFFPEGGRSRSGLLLPPKMGLLKYALQAAAELPQQALTLVPVAVDYETVIEHASYQAELKGGRKPRENLSEFVKVRRVLSKRYGRVFVRFAPPMAMEERAQQLKATGFEPQAMQRLGESIMSAIAGAQTLTATSLLATVLLAKPSRAMSEAHAYAAALSLCGYARALGGHLDGALSNPDKSVTRALSRLTQSRMVVQSGELLQVPLDQRLALAYYRHLIFPLFESHAIVAHVALHLSAQSKSVTLAELLQAAQQVHAIVRVHLACPAREWPLHHWHHTAVALSEMGVLTLSQSQEVVVRDQTQALLLESFVAPWLAIVQALQAALPELQRLPYRAEEFVNLVFARSVKARERGEWLYPEALQKTLFTQALSSLQSREGVHLLR